MIRKTKNESMDPVFDFEQVKAPIDAEETIQKSELSCWERTILLFVVAIVMAIIDGIFLFDMIDFVMVQNAVLGYIGTIGITLILNFIPLGIAKQINNARYKLERDAWWFAIIGITLFALLYAAVVLLRFNCLELYMDSSSSSLVNTISDAESNEVITEEAKSRALMTALLLAIEPLATSGFSFILAILTDNPLKNKIRALEKRMRELNIARNRVSTAIASMWEDKEFLLANDAALMNVTKEQIMDDASRLMAEGRMMLAEKLGNPSAISRLAVSEEEKTDDHISAKPGTMSFESAEKQIA